MFELIKINRDEQLTCDNICKLYNAIYLTKNKELDQITQNNETSVSTSNLDFVKTYNNKNHKYNLINRCKNTDINNYSNLEKINYRNINNYRNTKIKININNYRNINTNINNKKFKEKKKKFKDVLFLKLTL